MLFYQFHEKIRQNDALMHQIVAYSMKKTVFYSENEIMDFVNVISMLCIAYATLFYSIRFDSLESINYFSYQLDLSISLYWITYYKVIKYLQLHWNLQITRKITYKIAFLCEFSIQNLVNLIASCCSIAILFQESIFQWKLLWFMKFC